MSAGEPSPGDAPLAASNVIDFSDDSLSDPPRWEIRGYPQPCTKGEVLETFKKICKRYLIDAFTGMSQGLFVTLIAGLIIKQLGSLFGQTTRGGKMLIAVGNVASLLTGPGIGIGIAKALSDHNLVIFAAGIAGMIGAWSPQYIDDKFGHTAVPLSPGNPIGSYICGLITTEVGNLIVMLKTRLDILLVPLGMFLATIGAVYVCLPFRAAGTWIGETIEKATDAQPFWMSIVMSVWVGLLLTLPTSSAATCISLNIHGTAGGAAVTGCCCHMVGFAVASFRENGWRGVLSQGIGTSMLQIPNLVNHPLILVPQVISSLIVGPIAACAFELECTSAAAGMGTAGLVGLFGTIDGSGGKIPAWQVAVGITVCHFVAPIILSVAISELMRWFGWIKLGDQLLELHKENEEAEEKKKEEESVEGEIGEEKGEQQVDAQTATA
jgi:uncharacterized membrane protein